MILLSGCGGSDADSSGAKSGEKQAVALKEIQPTSGGKMVLVPAGQFTMGGTEGSIDAPQHEVALDAFYIDRFPVTQAVYEQIMGVNPSQRKGAENPVERTLWTDAVRFCNKCSEQERLTPCYNLDTWECDFSADGYRLPTEAEWEYACRAGGEGKYFFGDDESELPVYAWCKPHSRGRTHPVGEKPPNRWGLYDMHGNVWEWCNDFYSDTYYTNSPAENPRGPSDGEKRVLRGGAWKSTAQKCAAGYRFQEFPVFADACFGADSYGFRRVRRGDVSVEATPLKVAEVEKKLPSEPAVVASTTTTPAPVSQNVAEQATITQGKIDSSRLRGTIVFVRNLDGKLDIWKMRANGQDVQQLTNDEHSDADPRFSPDGKQIMYTSLREGFPQVWGMNFDGSEPQKIVDGMQASWSPDGKSILLIRDDQAYVRNLESGQERLVAPQDWQRCGTPAWSPDGKEIAIASRHQKDIGIYIFPTEGESYRQLKTEDPCCTPQWDPAGQRIVFQTTKGHIHQLESDTEEQITFGADVQHEARYSPDGSMIVFCRAPATQGPWQICIADLNSDNLDFIQLTLEGSNSLPDWHAVE